MKLDQDVSQFLNNEIALIVEPSSAFFSVIQSCLNGFGMSSAKILSANSYSDAVLLIKEHKPKILITEYTIGKHFGLSLVEKHGEIYDSLSRISIMVTKESSDNAVAEAAEEQLDAYIVKPFSMSDLKSRLLDVIKRKMYPSVYFQKIREGKELIKNNKISEAADLFAEAKKLNPTPTLACYYLGECFVAKNDFVSARNEFHEGRSHNKLHYKCLTGEFECFMKEENYKEAYLLVNTIRQNFPVTSVRLGKFFIAAVYTESFQDLNPLYELFLNLDYRPPELVNLVSLALITAGRYYVRAKDQETALIYFEMAATVSGRSIDILEKIVDELVKNGEVNSAEKFFKYIRSDEINSAKHQQLNFKIGRFILSPDQLIEMGRKIITEKKASPEVARLVIKLAIDGGKQTLAESLIIKSVETFPEIRKDLYALLENKK
jgi:CheY-like chemotaxis protein